MNMKKGIWTFIVAVAAADVYFLWICRDTAMEWEANPVARWAMLQAGVAGAVGLRLGVLGYAWAMTQVRSRLGWLVTPVWGLVHVGLLVVLMQSYAAAGMVPGLPAGTSLPLALLHP